MSLERSDVERIAKLAHLALDEAEIEAFRGQLSSVLGYVDRLAELDTTGLEPAAHVTGVHNVMREDAVRATPKETRDALLDAAPAREGDLIKVRNVFK